MEYLLTHWSPDFIVIISVQVVGLLAAGVFLGASFWLIGFVVHHLLKVMKGGV